MLDGLTFGAAALAWLLLTLLVAATLGLGERLARWRPLLAVATGAVATSHALLVWHHRLGWDATRAWEKSPLGFLTFHMALVLVVLLGLRPTARGGWPCLAFPAWFLVAAGATAAPFRCDLPPGVAPVVWTTTAFGLVVLGAAAVRRMRRRGARGPP